MTIILDYLHRYNPLAFNLAYHTTYVVLILSISGGVYLLLRTRNVEQVLIVILLSLRDFPRRLLKIAEILIFFFDLFEMSEPEVEARAMY